MIDLIKGSRKLVNVCLEHDLKQIEVEARRETFLKSGEKALKVNSNDEQALK